MPKSKRQYRFDDPGVGPLTLAEARRLLTGKAASSPKRAIMPARRRRLAAGNAPAASLPEAMGAERNRRRLDRVQEEKRRLQDYAATLSLLKKRGVQGLVESAPLKAGVRRGLGTPSRAGLPLQVLAEGDSWFDYPMPLFGGGVIPRLEDRIGVPILNMAKAGDEVRYMLGVHERTQLAKRLRDGCPAGGQWDALLFSGGGNDIVDNPMALWIHDYDANASPDQLLNQARFDTVLGLVRAGYEDLITMRDQLSPKTHLFFHAYDFAIPDGRGVCWLGPWLKPTFDLRGFPKVGNARFEVVKVMLTQFAQMLQKFATNHADVTFVATQGTLSVQRSSWHNELHPSKRGFDSIADVFHEALKAVFPSRVL